MPTGTHITQRPVSNALLRTQLNYKNTMTKTNQITWNVGNSKLPKRIIHFSLPSGHTCPAANECLSRQI